MAFTGANSAAQIQLNHIELKIFAQVGGDEGQVAIEFETSIAALTDYGAVGFGIGGFEGEIFFLKAPGFEALHSADRLDALQGLRRSNAQLGRILPAPDLAGLQNRLQGRSGRRGAESAEGLDGLQADVAAQAIA